jgi:hypothetical protein
VVRLIAQGDAEQGDRRRARHQRGNRQGCTSRTSSHKLNVNDRAAVNPHRLATRHHPHPVAPRVGIRPGHNSMP